MRLYDICVHDFDFAVERGKENKTEKKERKNEIDKGEEVDPSEGLAMNVDS